MVSGRALLHGIRPKASLNVWIWNGEDPIRDELIAASPRRQNVYGVGREECHGCLFDWRNLRMVIARKRSRAERWSRVHGGYMNQGDIL